MTTVDEEELILHISTILQTSYIYCSSSVSVGTYHQDNGKVE